MISTTLDADGVLVARIDMPGRTMNVFSADLMDALDVLMDRVDREDAVRSVVVTSGKASFLVGADLAMVRGYTERAKTATHTQMFDLCGRLGRQFVRLEACAKPWVAAVNGIALGGGLELALACRERIVADDPRIQLGTPEVRWGLLPGAGGTQRLPRMAGFEAGLGLLLTGRSITPGDAVRLGLFARAVPAARLVDEARVVARALHGKRLDMGSKYAQLPQTDVPPPSAVAANAIATRHGVGEETFRQYPAYGAIIDSVIEGARLPLAEANAIEMKHFLRLMFNPVAGNMVRTLFLERLRAEHELGAPAGSDIECIGVGPIGAPRLAWADALANVKLAQVADASLPADTLELIDRQGRRHRVALRVLDEAPSVATDGLPLAVLAPAGPYGRVLEIVDAEGATAGMLAALALRLRALPWHVQGPQSVMQQMRGQPLLSQAMIALACAVRPAAGDPAFLDVAACLAGVSPAWTGGPLTWLWAERGNLVPQFDAVTLQAWNKLEPQLRDAFA